VNYDCSDNKPKEHIHTLPQAGGCAIPARM
jgi:hypothetical protein